MTSARVEGAVPAAAGDAAVFSPTSRRPAVLVWLALYYVWKVVWGYVTIGQWLAHTTSLPPGQAQGYMLVFLAGIVWTSVCLGLLVPNLFEHKRWAWAAMQGSLVVQSGTALAVLVNDISYFSYLLQKAGGPRALQVQFLAFPLVTALLNAAAMFLLAVFLFRSREWFGAERRRGWHTVCREGWWALAITTLLTFGYVLTWLVPIRR